jgi:hypothetical protein
MVRIQATNPPESNLFACQCNQPTHNVHKWLCIGMNVSLGVSSFSAKLPYIDKEGNLKAGNNLSDAMRIPNGNSALCIGTLMVSVTCSAKIGLAQ